jgi:hypothetical protein
LKRRSALYILALSVTALFFQGVTFVPPDIDHAKVIKSLNGTTLKRGAKIYHNSCIACHGKDGTASLPQARSFNKDRLRFGNKPYDMWKTISNGAGMMAAQTWLSPAERYYVIQYIREEFMKKSNPRQYFKITDEYLATLPKSQRSIQEQLTVTKQEALKGSLKYGQEWFMYNKSNYGYAIHSQLKDHTTAAFTVYLDKDVLLSYDLLRMGTTAAWHGKLNVSDTKYNRYRGEGEPFIEGKEIEGLQLWQWTYNDQLDALKQSTGVRSPLPSEFMDYHGYYKNGKDVILSYSILGRKILEHPRVISNNNKIILSHTLKIDPGMEQTLFIGQLSDSNGVLRNESMSADGVFIKENSMGSGKILVSSARLQNVTGKFIAAGVITDATDVKWTVDDKNRMKLTIPSSQDEIILNVLRISGKGDTEL